MEVQTFVNMFDALADTRAEAANLTLDKLHPHLAWFEFVLSSRNSPNMISV